MSTFEDGEDRPPRRDSRWKGDGDEGGVGGGGDGGDGGGGNGYGGHGGGDRRDEGDEVGSLVGARALPSDWET